MVAIIFLKCLFEIRMPEAERIRGRIRSITVVLFLFSAAFMLLESWLMSLIQTEYSVIVIMYSYSQRFPYYCRVGPNKSHFKSLVLYKFYHNNQAFMDLCHTGGTLLKNRIFTSHQYYDDNIYLRI